MNAEHDEQAPDSGDAAQEHDEINQHSAGEAADKGHEGQSEHEGQSGHEGHESHAPRRYQPGGMLNAAMASLGGARLQRKLQQRALQRKAAAAGAQEGAALHRATAEGVQGASQPLPHGEQIQRAFGAHDISHTQAFVGGAAEGACDRIGASAYATGKSVAFRSSPDLHTAAHEATHIVQQRAGVQLKGGVGEEGDSYEQQADAVADAVVAGQSAEHLLPKDSKAAPEASEDHRERGAQERAVQCTKKTLPPVKQRQNVDPNKVLKDNKKPLSIGEKLKTKDKGRVGFGSDHRHGVKLNPGATVRDLGGEVLATLPQGRPNGGDHVAVPVYGRVRQVPITTAQNSPLETEVFLWRIPIKIDEEYINGWVNQTQIKDFERIKSQLGKDDSVSDKQIGNSKLSGVHKFKATKYEKPTLAKAENFYEGWIGRGGGDGNRNMVYDYVPHDGHANICINVPEFSGKKLGAAIDAVKCDLATFRRSMSVQQVPVPVYEQDPGKNKNAKVKWHVHFVYGQAAENGRTVWGWVMKELLDL